MKTEQLTRVEDSTNEAVNHMFRATLNLPTDLLWYIRACEADTGLPSFHTTTKALTNKMIRFILDKKINQYSLDGIHRIIEFLIEINQQALSACKEEQMHGQLLTLVYDYYRISHGTSQLYIDFVKLLKDASDSWSSIMFALEQLVGRCRAEDYTCAEMLQQLNDLEASISVKFSDNFITVFAYICKNTVGFSFHLNEEIQRNENLNSLKVLAQVSSITIAGVFSMVATYFGDTKLFQDMRYIDSYPSWLHVIQSFSGKSGELSIVSELQMKPTCDYWELRLLDFCLTADLFQELKNNMRGFDRLTNENEKDMMLVIHKFKEKINKFCVTIENMSSHAQKYSRDITELGRTLDQFVADGNIQVTKSGVCFIRDRGIQQLEKPEDSVRHATGILYRATLSLPADLPWLICACGTDAGLHSCHSIINDHTNSMIKVIIEHEKQHYSLDCIRKIFECLLDINQKSVEGSSEVWRPFWSGLDIGFYDFIRRAFELYGHFLSFLKEISDSWLCVKLTLNQIMVRSGEGNCAYEEMVQQLNDLGTSESVGISFHYFLKSLELFCKQTTSFSRYLINEIQDEENEVFRAAIVGSFAVMATFSRDSKLLQEAKGITSNSKLFDWVAKKDGDYFHVMRGVMMRRFGRELQVWDFYGNAILRKLKKKMAQYDFFAPEIEEEMVIVIDKVEKKINNFSEAIEDMCSRHAQKRYISYVETDNIQQLKQNIGYMREAMSTLYQATVSLRACETNIDFHSGYAIARDHMGSTTDFFVDYEKQKHSLDGIHTIFKCVDEIRQDASRESYKSDRLGAEYRQISYRTFEVYNDFVNMLICMSRNWLRVRVALEQIVVTSRTDNYTYEKMMQELNFLEADTSVRYFYHKFVRSSASICVEITAFFRNLIEKFQNDEWISSLNLLAKVSRATIVGFFSFMATFMGDLEVLQLLKDITSNDKLLNLIQILTSKGGKWFNKRGDLMKRSYGGELMVWDFYGVAIVHQLKKKMGGYDGFSGEIEEEMKIIINKLEKSIHHFSKAIEDMSTHALKLLGI